MSRSTPSQTVYVADAAVSEVAVFGSVVLPDVSTGAEPTNLEHEGSVTLNGTVDPDGEPVTSCQFEYGTETSYGSVVPREPAPRVGVEPGRGSRRRERADAAHQLPLPSCRRRRERQQPGFDRTFVAPARPRIESESVLAVTSGSAELLAQINPGWKRYGVSLRIWSDGVLLVRACTAMRGAGASGVTARLLLRAACSPIPPITSGWWRVMWCSGKWRGSIRSSPRSLAVVSRHCRMGVCGKWSRRRISTVRV